MEVIRFNEESTQSVYRLLLLSLKCILCRHKNSVKTRNTYNTHTRARARAHTHTHTHTHIFFRICKMLYNLS